MKSLLPFIALMFPLAGWSNSPNIIYILADDLGYADVACYGQEHFETPHIDRLAATGMRFTNHYSGSTVCAPARSTLMTGLHTGHAPVRGNAELRPEGQVPMPADTRTIAHFLQEAGYATGIFGKWGLGAPGSDSEPLQMGFDRFFGYNCQRLAHNYYPYFLWDDDQRVPLWDNFGKQTNTYAPTLIHQEALDFIETNKDQPFFCYYAIVQPHAEMFAPEAYMQKYRGKFLPEKAYQGTDGGPGYRNGAYGSQPEAHAAFAAMVNCIDDYVGDIVAKLKDLGIEENTLVIFSSDNGPHREAGHDPVYFDSNGPLRGYKRDLYEGGIRVPMIAVWPDRIQPDTDTDHVSAFWDVMPTLLEATGSPVPEGIDGISFLPTLVGDGKQEEHAFLYWEFHERGGRVAVRRGQWKGVRYDVDTDANSLLELYDLSNDMGETTNLADRHPQVVEELEMLIRQARTEHANPKFNFR